jgi:hypothetical protein
MLYEIIAVNVLDELSLKAKSFRICFEARNPLHNTPECYEVVHMAFGWPLLWAHYRSFAFYKRKRIPMLSEQQLAFKEALYSMEIFYLSVCHKKA